jgi:hypothetical protein
VPKVSFCRASKKRKRTHTLSNRFLDRLKEWSPAGFLTFLTRPGRSPVK